jgi:sarcosine oxidase delta subunit
MITEQDIIDGTKSAMDHLLFRNYIFNRRNRPDITPERWAKVFGQEKIFVLEKQFLDMETKTDKIRA